MQRLAIFVVVTCMLAMPALAEEGRFQLERAGDGFVRLDRQTGEVSHCTERDGQTICRAAADERMALMAEVERLEKRIDSLEERVAKLETEAGGMKLPGKEQLEQSLGVMEQLMQRFFGMIEDLERRFGTEGAEPPSESERT